MPRAASSFETLEIRRLLAVDLRAEDLYRLRTPEVGEAVPFSGSMTVVNRGDAPTAGPVAVRFIFRETGTSTDTVVGNVTTDGAVTVTEPGKVGNDSGVVDFSFAVPTALIGKTGQFRAVVDPDDAIAESDETNNVDIYDGIRVAPTIAGGRIDGTAGDDRFIFVERDGVVLVYTIVENFQQIYQMAAVADLPKLTVDLKGGDDRVEQLFADGFTVPMEILGGAGVDILSGGAGKDTIHGDDGDDVVRGQLGDDELYGDAGSDAVNGQGGNDFVGGGTGNDNLAGGDGDDSLAGDAGNDTVRGDAGDDRVAGNAGSDRLRGNAGDDTLLGQNGRDYLYGNAGADLLIGGGGNDVLSVDATADGVDTLSGNGGRDEGFAPASALLASIELRHTL